MTKTAARLAALLASAASVVAQISQQDGLCTRWGHQSGIINDKLYLMGGFKLSRSTTNQETTSSKLDLSSSAPSFQVQKGINFTSPPPWTVPNFTVVGAPSLPHVSNGGMFTDDSNLYILEGRLPHGTADISSSLWLYNGTTHEWGEAQTWGHTDSNLPLRYSRFGSVSVPGGAYGIAVGGARIFINDSATPENGNFYYPPDEQMVTFDLTIKNGKRNRTATTLPASEKRIGSSLAYIPGVGAEGVVVIIAGTDELPNVRESETDANIATAKFDPDDLAFNNFRLTQVLDLATGKWRTQTTTGEYFPPNRMHACVAVQSAPDNSSHNIYMYGGGSGSGMYELDDQQLFNELWILSLPSFRWIRKVFTDVDGNPKARQQHTCHTIGNNMLILGGATNASGLCAWDEISFMDMTSLTFLSQYSYNSNQYALPDIVKAATFTNGQPQQDPANGWDDDELAELFRRNDDDKSTNHLPAIIGGIIGGVVVLISIALIAFLLFRRYRRKRRLQQQPHLPGPSNTTAYLGHDPNTGEGGGRNSRFYPESNRTSHYAESTYSLQSPAPLSAYSHIDNFAGGGEKGQSQNSPLIAPPHTPYFELANVEPYRNVGEESIRRPVRQQTTRYELGGI